MTSTAERMKAIITEALEPDKLEIIDQSDDHIGHAGHDGQGESHFKIEIEASAFEGKNRLERHKMIYELLDSELKDRVHALSISATTPKN